jgi:hypothetical protein
MTVARVFLDVEGPIKAWLRTQTYLTDLLTTHGSAPSIDLSTPRNYGKPTWPDKPWVVLQSVNDMPVAGGGPNVLVATVQFDVYGPTRAAVSQAAAALVSVVESMPSGTVLDTTTTAHGAVVRRNQWLPDPSNGLPRRSLDIEFTVYATPGG